MTEEEKLERIKAILINDERKSIVEIGSVLDNEILLSERVGPIIQKHIEFLKNNYPAEFHDVVNKQIETKLIASQDELIQILYPALGKMLTKFIAQQFQMMKDSIDLKLKSMFSIKGFKTYAKARILGIDISDEFLSSIDVPILNEIYLIEKNSGILIGNASIHENINSEVIAGMLTAIKAFAEDAFDKQNEELEMIEYGTYKLLLFNFYKYYFALAMTGSISEREKMEYNHHLLEFKNSESLLENIKHEDKYQKLISQKLLERFILPQKSILIELKQKM
jgi:hypothetical protein